MPSTLGRVIQSEDNGGFWWNKDNECDNQLDGVDETDGNFTDALEHHAALASIGDDGLSKMAIDPRFASIPTGMRERS